MKRIGRLLLVASGAAAAAATALRYRSDLADARLAAGRGSLIVDTDVGLIEYAERGTGVPLLSIHGAGGGFDQGLANATEFADEGFFRIIAPSRFGYLRTPVPPDASSAAQADAHAALLSKLNVAKAIVLGVSAGARSAVELAVRRPDLIAALILIVPGLYSPTSPVSVDSSRGSKFAFWAVSVGGNFAWRAAEMIAPSILVRFVGVRPELAAAAPQSERERVISIVAAIQPLSLRSAGINIDSSPDLHELPLQRIDAPTLIVSARDDLFNTLPAAEYVASKIAGAKLVVYDAGGHLLVGHREDVRETIGGFLAAAGLAPASHEAIASAR